MHPREPEDPRGGVREWAPPGGGLMKHARARPAGGGGAPNESRSGARRSSGAALGCVLPRTLCGQLRSQTHLARLPVLRRSAHQRLAPEGPPKSTGHAVCLAPCALVTRTIPWYPDCRGVSRPVKRSPRQSLPHVVLALVVAFLYPMLTALGLGCTCVHAGACSAECGERQEGSPDGIKASASVPCTHDHHHGVRAGTAHRTSPPSRNMASARACSSGCDECGKALLRNLTSAVVESKQQSETHAHRSPPATAPSAHGSTGSESWYESAFRPGPPGRPPRPTGPSSSSPDLLPVLRF